MDLMNQNYIKYYPSPRINLYYFNSLYLYYYKIEIIFKYFILYIIYCY